MNTYCRFVLILAIGGIPLGRGVANPAASPARSSTGKVLILDSERIFEGDIEQVGDQYRIRRGMGEFWLPAGKGLRLCSSWEEAYEFMKSRANVSDADERLRLARWCQTNGLTVQALVEVTAALELRPAHAPAQQLKTILQRALPESKTLGIFQPAQAAGAPAAPVILDLSSETQIQFTRKVQPILMNACINCHSNGRGGAFQLFRPYEGGGYGGTTQKNLAAVLAQINLEKPVISRLLVKAVSPHYPSSHAPPLNGRDSVPFATLQNWVQMLVANNPHLVETYGKPPPAAIVSRPGWGGPPAAMPFAGTEKKVEGAPGLLPGEIKKPAPGFDIPLELSLPGSQGGLKQTSFSSGALVEPINKTAARFDVPNELTMPQQGNIPEEQLRKPVEKEAAAPVVSVRNPTNAKDSIPKGPGKFGELAQKPVPTFDVPYELPMPPPGLNSEEVQPRANAIREVIKKGAANQVGTENPALPKPETKQSVFASQYTAKLAPAPQMSGETTASRPAGPSPAQGMTGTSFASGSSTHETAPTFGPGDPFDPMEFNRHMHPRQ